MDFLKTFSKKFFLEKKLDFSFLFPQKNFLIFVFVRLKSFF